jgi:TolA-binding protein
MSRAMWLRGSAALCAGCLLHACASAPPPAFFASTPQDRSAVQAMAREQQRQAQTCSMTRSCDRVHYVQGLAALYEDRAEAVKHFRAVVADAPNGRYAASSRHWLRLLEESSNGSSRAPRLMQTVDRLVREVLEYEATAQRAAMRPPEPKAAEIPVVQSLRQQLKAQEKRIEELTEQIDALKRVDQEVQEQVKPGRPVH